MNLKQLERDINEMQKSHDLLSSHHEFMTRAFEKSHFSSIAARFKHYKVLIQSMEVLNTQSRSYKDLVV